MVSIREALQKVADNPEYTTDALIDAPVHELVARTLFDIANKPDSKVRGSMARATKAQRIIFNRIGGTRRPGTKPASKQSTQVTFVDLTKTGEITV